MVASGNQLLAAQNVTVVGSGEEVVVLAHGFGSDQSMWQHVLPSLVDVYKVVLFDLPGAGSTNPDDFDFSLFESYDGFADSLLAILAELHVKSCKYVGHSMSAMIGCIAAIKQPQLFDSLVLLCGSPRYLNDKDYYGGFEQEDVNHIFEAIKSNFQGWAAGFAPLAVGVNDRDTIDKFNQTLSRMRPDVAFAIAKTIFESDYRSILSEVKVTCHVLQTTKDLAVPLVVSDYLRRNLGGKGTVEVLQTEGHLPQLTSPDVFVSTLKKVLANEDEGF